MHLALLIYGSLDILTGGYLYDRMMVEQWQALGDRVEIISLPWRSPARHVLDNVSHSFYRRLISREPLTDDFIAGIVDGFLARFR